MTTQRAVMSPCGVQNRAVGFAGRPTRRGSGTQVRRRAADGVGGQRQGGRPGADDRLVGHGQAAERARAEGGHLPVDLGGVDDLAARVAVLVGLGLQSGQRGEFLGVPGHQQRPGALDRDPGLLGVVRQQACSRGDQPGFQRAGLGVEPGVQDGGVGLAGAVADVVAGLDQRDRCVAGEFSRDRRADDAGADARTTS